MGRHTVNPALKRGAVISVRTSIAGKRDFQIWCARRRIDMSSAARQAILEYTQKYSNIIPEVTGADPDEH